jgi:hypothetical protein
MERCLLLITKYEIIQTGGIVSNQLFQIVVPPVEFYVIIFLFTTNYKMVQLKVGQFSLFDIVTVQT